MCETKETFFYCLLLFAFETHYFGTSKNNTRRQDKDSDSRERLRKKGKEDQISFLKDLFRPWKIYAV